MKKILLLLGLTITCSLSYGQGDEFYDSTSYFPIKLYTSNLPEAAILDSIKRARHSTVLKVLKEEKLFKLNTKKEIYRLTWLRSFHPPMIIKLEKNGDEISLISKIGNKVGLDNSYYDLSKLTIEERDKFYAFSQGQVDSSQIKDILLKDIFVKDTVSFSFREVTRKVSMQEFMDFKDLLGENNFWNLVSQSAHLTGSDGADWILEAKEAKNGYHMVYRWSPEVYPIGWTVKSEK